MSGRRILRLIVFLWRIEIMGLAAASAASWLGGSSDTGQVLTPADIADDELTSLVFLGARVVTTGLLVLTVAVLLRRVSVLLRPVLPEEAAA